jgi:hypothetical protein
VGKELAEEKQNKENKKANKEIYLVKKSLPKCEGKEDFGKCC